MYLVPEKIGSINKAFQCEKIAHYPTPALPHACFALFQKQTLHTHINIQYLTESNHKDLISLILLYYLVFLFDN